jgi:hypothetical protein
MTLTRRALAPLALSAAACRAPVPPAMAAPVRSAAAVSVPPLLTLTVAAAGTGGHALASARCFFGPGALPRAAVLIGRCAALAQDLPVEVVVLAAHADGSARIALLSFILPRGAAPCEVAILAGHAEAGVPRPAGAARA